MQLRWTDPDRASELIRRAYDAADITDLVEIWDFIAEVTPYAPR
jgi:hypothetical protein